MIDLHLHTTASDGRLSPAALVSAAGASGLTIISITDHDTIGGFLGAQAAAAASGVECIAGIEITAVADGRDIHVLGYFIDPRSAALTAFLERQRADRLRRISAMADRLAALGSPIDTGPIFKAGSAGQSVGRPQIADALLAAGHVASRNDAFDRLLGRRGAAYVPREGSSPADVVSLLHEAGGLASLAHPGLTGRDDLIPGLAEAGLDALEVRHSDHDEATEARYRELARELGLLVTGGSDFHGAAGGHRVPALGLVTLPAADWDAFRAAARRRQADG